MARKLTRGQFLKKSGTTALGLAAGGALLQGCDPIEYADAEKTRPPGAPASVLAKTEDVQTSYYVAKGKLKAILIRTGKTIRGYVNTCSHEEAALYFAKGVLYCPVHGSHFDPVTGEARKKPATKPLTAIKLKVEKGLVLLVKA